MNLPATYRATWTADPRRLGSVDFMLFRDGDPAVKLDMSRWRERATFWSEDREFQIVKRGVFRPTWTLSEVPGDDDDERVPRAVAESRGLLRRNMEIRVGDNRLLFLRGRVFSWSFDVLIAGQPIGQLRRQSLFKRTLIAEFPSQLPEPEAVLLIFLTLAVWRRRRRAASGAG